MPAVQIPSRLLGISQRVMAHYQEVFDSSNVDLPERRYLTSGDIVADCESFIITLSGLTSGIPGIPLQGPQTCEIERFANLDIFLFRCCPIGNGDVPPSAEELQDFGQNAIIDAWTLAWASESIDAVLEEGFKLHTWSLQTLKNQGGLGGSNVSLAVAL